MALGVRDGLCSSLSFCQTLARGRLSSPARTCALHTRAQPPRQAGFPLRASAGVTGSGRPSRLRHRRHRHRRRRRSRLQTPACAPAAHLPPRAQPQPAACISSRACCSQDVFSSSATQASRPPEAGGEGEARHEMKRGGRGSHSDAFPARMLRRGTLAAICVLAIAARLHKVCRPLPRRVCVRSSGRGEYASLCSPGTCDAKV